MDPTDARGSVVAVSDKGCMAISKNNTHRPAVQTTAASKMTAIQAGE